MRHALVVSVFAMLSCAATDTSFRGSAKVPDGVAGCKAKCSSYGMELTGMVALGDYSDGCICELPGKRSATAGAAASGAVAAVMEEVRLQQQRKPDLWSPEPSPPPVDLPRP